MNTKLIAFIVIAIIVYVYLMSERLTNINYDVGRATSQAGQKLSQPGQIGDSGHGGNIPGNLPNYINYPRQKDGYVNYYDMGTQFHIPTDERKTFTEDDLRLLSLERSRFNPSFIDRQA